MRPKSPCAVVYDAAPPLANALSGGTILGFKEVENDYGVTVKMIVRLEPTNAKVYLTLPSSLCDAERGSRIQFTATFERSKDDPFFGFGSRPSKASILS